MTEKDWLPFDPLDDGSLRDGVQRCSVALNDNATQAGRMGCEVCHAGGGFRDHDARAVSPL